MYSKISKVKKPGNRPTDNNRFWKMQLIFYLIPSNTCPARLFCVNLVPAYCDDYWECSHKVKCIQIVDLSQNFVPTGNLQWNFTDPILWLPVFSSNICILDSVKFFVANVACRLQSSACLRSYLSTIPTYNSHFNSYLLLSKSENSFLKNSHFSKKEFPLLLKKKW